jgi:hypothetical protein
MSKVEMVIACQMLATPMHVVNERYFSLFNDQYFIIKYDHALHAFFLFCDVSCVHLVCVCVCVCVLSVCLYHASFPLFRPALLVCWP